jgi:hypothetical protein
LNSLKNQNLYSITLSDIASSEKLSQHSWLVVLHASRKPPHIGMLINGTYHSLTIKGQETNVSLPVLLKTIQQKKIETVFVKLKKHPVFSYDYQNEIFQWQIKQFKKVNPNEASCLSPVKLFLSEFYAVNRIENELLFELIERLLQNDYIDDALALNVNKFVKGQPFYFPIYTYIELQEVILNEQLKINKS